MRSTRTFLKFLEKRSKKPIAISQMKDLANYVIINKFSSKNNQAIIFCHEMIKKRVVRNIYLRYVRKFGIFDCYLIYSNIIDRNMLGDKWETFFMLYNENGETKMRVLSAKNPKHWGVIKIISGGQTGADMAGIMAGRFMRIITGGLAPLNYMTEIGCNRDLIKFGLNEDENANYFDRTLSNVLESDATIIFGNSNSVGSKLTKKCCKKYYRPFKLISKIGKLGDKKKSGIIRWFIENDIKILNIAGNRESVNRGIEQKVFLFLVELLSRSNLVKARAREIVKEKLYNKLYEQYISEVKL